jgi:aspartyl-tRNA(Asn)/glutamyl-tRNA(Gln) amidotransferase subunit A
MTDWHRLGISELHSAYAAGEVAPAAVLDHYLARIDRHDSTLRSYIAIDAASARMAADRSLQRIREDVRRPLEGIPVAVKANIAVRGLELNAGMKAREGIIAAEDAAVVTRLREAGAVVVGTLNMHEAALGAVTDNPFFGRCLNPHGEGRTPGGSSGGSGAAVSAGLCVAALGTDTLGSIRIPSAYCGVFGLKPTTGAIADAGLVPLSARFDAIGPIARSMDDLSILTNVLVNPDLSVAMRRSRFLLLDGLGGVACEPEVARAFDAAVATLPGEKELLSLPAACGEVRTSAFVLAARDLAVHLVDLGEARCEAFSEELAYLIDFAVMRDAADVRQDAARVAETARIVRAEIGDNGILLMPTAPQTAFAQGTRAPSNQADFTALANVAGLPSISIPIGFGKDSMPVGMQLVGPPGGEAMLVAHARMINDAVRGYAPPRHYW